MVKKDFRFGISADIRGVDLNKVLIENPASTFFMRLAEDESELGLFKDDVILVDRSIKPRPKDIVVVNLESDPRLRLSKFETLKNSAQCWGVITHLIRSLKQ